MKYVIALGANIGNPAENVATAIEKLREHFNNFKASTLYITKPVGYLDQPDFVNAVVIGESQKTPREIFQILQALEQEFGRVRDIKWGPRTLDLDLIDCGVESDDPLLTLPHPRAKERRFVLEPWYEIQPDAVLTGEGAIKTLLENLE